MPAHIKQRLFMRFYALSVLLYELCLVGKKGSTEEAVPAPDEHPVMTTTRAAIQN